MALHVFNLPDVGEGLSEGEIVKWHVAPGDVVKADQIIVDVQTDKAIVEIPSPVTGTIVRLGGAPNDVLPIGAMLAEIDVGAPGDVAAPGSVPAGAAAAPDRDPVHARGSAAAESARPRAVSAGAGPAAVAAALPHGHGGTPGVAAPAAVAPPSARPGRALASPATRKRARELGVDLTAVQGSGSRGQVTRQDVEAAAAAPARAAADPGTLGGAAAEAGAGQAPSMAPPPPAGEDRIEPLRGLRRQVALSMQEAWRSVPHIFSMDDIDATELVRARASLNDELAAAGVRLSYLPFFVKACVAALKAHPRFNASIDVDAGQIVYRHRYNIGIATATPEGLIVTVVHDADRKSLAEIGEEIAHLAGLARERRVGLEHLSNGTFTISNYGSYGGLMGTPIIRPPEVAIAGFGRLHDAVVPVDGQPAVRKRLPFCVSTDHRLNDGEHLGAFIDVMTRCLREPVRLLGQR